MFAVNNSTSVRTVKNICCIGAGYVGGPTSAVIAKQSPHIKVTVADLSEPRIAAWKTDSLPIYEPGLFDVVKPARDGTDGRAPNLFFSTNVAQAISEADMIFIAVNTPTKTMGVGAGSASDLAYVESAARMIAEVSTSDKIIVEKSTVPCGTADSLREILSAHQSDDVHFDILSNPEFLAEGTAINDLLRPDRILIGSLTDIRAREAAEALAQVYAGWVPRERIITINLWSSELAKLAANCMLAQRISSINSLSALCEATGANIEELAYAVGLDTRIGSKMLKASAGFGGSCFKKDVLSLSYIAASLHLPEVSAYWKSVVDINEYQKERFAKRITKRLYNTLRGKKISILGFAYKKNTGDTRESAAITIVGQLLAEGAHIAIYDPQVSEKQIFLDLGYEHSPEVLERNVSVHKDALSACADASAIVILTEWDHFKTDHLPEPNAEMLKQQQTSKHKPRVSITQGNNPSPPTSDSETELHTKKPSPVPAGLVVGNAFTVALPSPAVTSEDKPFDLTTTTTTGAGAGANAKDERIDWVTIAKNMKKPRLVFDGRNVVSRERLAAVGFTVEGIGKTSVRRLNQFAA